MNSHGERLLRVTDRLTALTPGPFQRTLRTPVTSEEVPPAVAAASVVRFTLLLSLVAFALLAVGHLVDALPLHHATKALDADDDDSVWSWASIATEAAAAAVLALMAVTSTRKGALRFCAAAVAFFSLDDFIRIHEKLGEVATFFPHATRTLWPLLYLPLLAALMIQLWRIAEGGDKDVRVLVRGGLLALVVAVVMETGTPLLFAVGQGHGTVAYEVEVAIEEGLELAGWLWVAGGLAALLTARRTARR